MYECEFCGKGTTGLYVDCGMFFCDPGCAVQYFDDLHHKGSEEE